MPSGGINGWEGRGTEPAYGEVIESKRLMQQAPLVGQKLAGSATNAPRRAQRATQRRPQPQPGGSQPQPVTMPAAEELHPDVQIARTWAAIALEPGASPLIKSIAADAQERAAGLGS